MANDANEESHNDPIKIMMKFTAVTTLLAVTDGLSTKGMDGVPSRLQIRLVILLVLLILQMINDIKIKMDDMGKLRIGSLGSG